MSDTIFAGVVAGIRAATRHPLPATITGDQSFISDLGFDSMGIARLALALEDQFKRPILLDDWIAQEANPANLNVDSLCRYLAETQSDDKRETV